MQPVDTHCHLDFDQYDDDRDDIIKECRERMAAVVNVGTNHERNAASLELARQHDVISATMGLHPTYIKDLEPDEVDRIADQIREHVDEIVAVGEIGLDYHHIREQEWREKQEGVFRRLLGLAAELELPVALHTRDAEKRAMELVDGHETPVIQHCFNGHPALAEECIDRGYWVSISTQVTYSNRVQDIADIVPLDHILLETDAPFLWKDGRNVPWHVEQSAEQIATIKGLDVGDVVKQTTENAREALDL